MHDRHPEAFIDGFLLSTPHPSPSVHLPHFAEKGDSPAARNSTKTCVDPAGLDPGGALRRIEGSRAVERGASAPLAATLTRVEGNEADLLRFRSGRKAKDDGKKSA